MNTQDLIALAKKHGALVLPRLTGEFVAFAESEFVTFCAALSAAQPKADERGSAEPVGVAGVMPGTEGGFTMAHFMAKAVPVGTKLYRHPDSAQARDAAQAVELTDADIRAAMEEVDFTYNPTLFARAIERAVLAKNGLGGKHGE
jgi:hypothetical protein